MTEDQIRLGKAYRRAAIGLAVVAIIWIAAFLFGDMKGEGPANWLIPIIAAALSVVFFALYRKTVESRK